MFIPLVWYGFVFSLDPTDFAREYMLRAYSANYFHNSPSRLAEILNLILGRFSSFGPNFMLLGLVSSGYLLVKFERKHAFVFAPLLAEMLYFTASLTASEFYMIGVTCFISLASGRFLADVIKNERGVQLIGLLLFTYLIFISSNLLTIQTVEMTFFPILSLLLIILFLRSLGYVNDLSNRAPRSSITVIAFIFILTISGTIAYYDYMTIRIYDSSLSPFGESSFYQGYVVDYLNSHTEVTDIVYAESIFIFQLKCNAMDNLFVNNVTVHKAKYAVVDPYWRVYDVNPFYGVDIGTPRTWVALHWIRVRTFGNYNIYLNPSVATITGKYMSRQEYMAYPVEYQKRLIAEGYTIIDIEP
jgi:hypothetical protein